MDFLLYKKDLQKCSREQCFFLLIMYARARPLFLRTVFQILLWVSKKKKKKERKEISENADVATAAVLAQSVERVDCRAGGRGFDSWGRTNTQGLKITEK